MNYELKETTREEPRDIHDRAMEFSLRVIRLFRFLQEQKDPVVTTISKQLLRSSTSIGANLTEASSGESRADFVHKLTIAQKEARESLYWLKLLLKAELVPENRLQPLVQETNEIVAVLTSIIVNTKNSRPQSNS